MEQTNLADLINLALGQDPLLMLVIILLVRMLTQGKAIVGTTNQTTASGEARKEDSKVVVS